MSKKKKQKAKKAKPLTLKFVPKTQFEVCMEAIKAGRIAERMLKFYSPVTDDHCATIVAVGGDGYPDGMGLESVEGVGITAPTLEKALEWMKRLDQPYWVNFNTRLDKIESEG